VVARLGSSGMISAADEDKIVDALLAGDDALSAVRRFSRMFHMFFARFVSRLI
jgi:hypothetical protein